MAAFARLEELKKQLESQETSSGKVSPSLLREFKLTLKRAEAALPNMKFDEERDPGAARRYRQKLNACDSYFEKLLNQNAAEFNARVQAQKSTPGTHKGGGQAQDTTHSGTTTTEILAADQVVVAMWDTVLTASKPGCETVTRPLKGLREIKLPAGTKADALPSAEFTVHVYGVVRDSKGKPVGGVAVSLPGAKVGATTKADGSYYLPLKVAGRQPPTGKPETREQVNLTIKQLFAVVPEELAFSPGKPQVSVFSIENRADNQDITIQGLQVVGAPPDSVGVRIRRVEGAVHGAEGTRCVIGPGGFVNVEVRWDCPAGATDARIKVVPEDASLGAKSVLLRTGLTAKQIIGSHQAKVVALLQAQKASAAKPAATPPTAPPPPLPALDTNWLDTWRQENEAKINQIEAMLQKTAAENVPEVKAAPKPGVPETVDTAKATNVFNFFGGENHVTIFGPGTKATINPPPERLGAQGSQAVAKNQEKAGEKTVTPVHLEQGSVYFSHLDKHDPMTEYIDSYVEGREQGEAFVSPAVNQVKKFAGAVVGAVTHVASAAKDTLYNVVTDTLSVFSWNTKYEVRRDAVSGTTTVTVFEDSVEVQSLTGDRSQKTLHAGQRVAVGPQGFGALEELRADQLAAAAGLYAPAFLGLNPVTYEQTDVEQAVLVAAGEEPAPSDEPYGDLTLTCTADSHVYAYSYSGWNQANFGRYEHLGAGWHPVGGEKRTYLRFDLSGVDPASVGQAKLRLYHYHTGGSDTVALGVYQVTSPWAEGVGTYRPTTTAQPGEIAWVHQPSFDASLVAQFRPGTEIGKWIEVDMTPLVAAWLSGTPNHGLVIKAVGALSGAVPHSEYGFYSREDEEDRGPVLVLSSASGPAEGFDQASASLCASDEEFIRSLYHCITHREPTTQEFEAQVGRLKDGAPRQHIIAYFFASPGYVNQTHDNIRFITDACQAIYARPPTEADFKAWPRAHRNTIVLEMFKHPDHLAAIRACPTLWPKIPDRTPALNDPAPKATNYIDYTEGTIPIGELPVGARVVDPSWGWGKHNLPVTWIVVANDHYEMEESHVTLLTEELIEFLVFDDSTDRGHDHAECGYNHWGDSGSANATRGLRPWLNSSGIHAGDGFYQAFSESFKKAVLTTNLPNREWENGSTYITQDRVFLPSTTELGDRISDTFSIGTVYPYFQEAGNDKRVTKAGNSTYTFPYWTRSPSTHGVGHRVRVVSDIGDFESAYSLSADGSDGGFYVYGGPGGSFIGVRPALNLKSETLLRVAMKEPPEPAAPPGSRGAGDPAVLEKLQAEYGTPPAEGTVDESAEMARDLYGIDYRKTVEKAVDGDEGELANLFVMSLDGAAAEIHAGVLYRLRQGLGAETFETMLSRQAAISRKRVNDLIDHHRENAGMTPSAPQPPSAGSADDPGSYLVGGTFEEAASLPAGEGSLATDPLNPENRVLAFTADNHLVRPLAIPADVNDVRVTLRVLAPTTIRLEMLEPGRMAPGIKIRVRHSNGQENSGIGEWIVNPGEGWQELTMVLNDIGDFRKELSLEASWFDGAILLDDLKVTSAFPVFLAEEIYEHYATPAQVTYFYVVDPLFSSGRVSNVGSPEISDGKVSIDFVLDGEKQVLWFVERSREDDRAEVVVGPPNAGGDLFRLRRIDGKWAIAGIEEPEGI